MCRTKFYNFGRLRGNSLEMSFLHATLLPIARYNLIKFQENNSKGTGYGPHKVSSTDGQTNAGAITLSPEPIGRGIKKQPKVKFEISMTFRKCHKYMA